jgi:hypothetical protein
VDQAEDVQAVLEQKIAPAEAVLLELLKQTQAESDFVLGSAIKTFTIFLAIMGALFKFALDQNSTPDLRNALSALGVCICALSFVTIWFSEKVRRLLRKDLTQLHHALNSPTVAHVAQPLKYVEIVSVIFSTFCLTAWIYILLRPSRI